ncbi:hypothetical protein HanOQP8_Chr04g0130461 [Helianthus annuus]|nr:hypothetical protein HanOQP8_Chr04g0130461 [Helianthus annuus]
MELPPLNTETKKNWEFKSLVGAVKDIEILNNLKSYLDGLVDDGPLLRYLGGLKEWSSWFSRLYVWDGNPPMFDRVAWIKVIGVPVSLWDRHVFNRIGERCGRLLVKSEASFEDGNMAEDRMAILVDSGKRFSLEMDIKWKEHSFKVWVEEIAGQWSPSFLSADSPESSGNGESSVFERSIDSKSKETEGCMLDDDNFSCMGNHNDFSPPMSAAHVPDTVLLVIRVRWLVVLMRREKERAQVKLI